MSSNRFLEYIISNYNRFALDTTNTVNNYIDLQNRVERNLSRIIQSHQEQVRLETTERTFAEYNISVDNLRNEVRNINRSQRDNTNSRENFDRLPTRTNFNRIDEVLARYGRSNRSSFQENRIHRENQDANEIMRNDQGEISHQNVTESEIQDSEQDTSDNTNNNEQANNLDFLREQQRLRGRHNSNQNNNNSLDMYETEYSRNYSGATRRRELYNRNRSSRNLYNRNRNITPQILRQYSDRLSGNSRSLYLSSLLDTPTTTDITNTINTVLTSLSPVPVRPTTREIAIATEVIPYRDANDDQQTRCPIDLQTFEPEENVIRIIHCGHIFRENNLIRWFSNNVRCPLCRYDIREYNPLNTIRNPYHNMSSETTNNDEINNTEDDTRNLSENESELENHSQHIPITSEQQDDQREGEENEQSESQQSESDSEEKNNESDDEFDNQFSNILNNASSNPNNNISSNSNDDTSGNMLINDSLISDIILSDSE